MPGKENQQPAMNATGASPISRVAPPIAHRWKPGQSGNPSGKPRAAGWSIRERVNQLVEKDLTEKELRQLARNPSSGCTVRMAAERILRAMEFGDLSDFAGLMRGENTLEDLRAMGINTEVIKKIKSKTRMVPIGHGKVEEVVEREVELHDRAGAEFDRIVNQTAGNPMQPIEADLKSGIRPEVTEDQVQKLMDILAKTRPVEASPSDTG